MSENENRDETKNDEAPSNDLPDEVLVDTPVKAAHEDLVPSTEKEAEENETRAGEDFEGAPSAGDLVERDQDDDNDDVVDLNDRRGSGKNEDNG